MVELDRSQSTIRIIWHMCVAFCVTNAADTHSEFEKKKYCFSTAGMVTRTHLSIASVLILHVFFKILLLTF
jgi:hypothetical protein